VNQTEFGTRLDAAIKATNESMLWSLMPDEQLTPEAAKNFVKQFGLFTRHSRQCWANVVGNTPVLEVRRFVVEENLWEEEANAETAHYTLMVRMGKALGLSEADVDDAVPLPTTQVAFLAWETLTKNRRWLEGLAAKMTLERLNQKDLGNLSAVEAGRWMRQLNLSEADVEFWTLHAEVDQIHGDGTLDLILEHATSSEQLEECLAAAEASLAAFKIFLDGIAASGQPAD
jgi:pyrroloquinoline quinone (PQQ) biosynthesis protein C